LKAAFLCLGQAIIIAMVKVNCYPKYKSHINGRNLEQPFEDFLSASRVNFANGAVLKELEQFQNYLSNYKIILYDGLSHDRVIFEGNSFRTRNCTTHMILGTSTWLRTSRKLWQRTTCKTRVTHCRTICLIFVYGETTYQLNYFGTCSRWFLSKKCFQNHLNLKVKGKLVYQWRQVYWYCSFTVTGDSKHECFKRIFYYSNKK